MSLIAVAYFPLPNTGSCMAQLYSVVSQNYQHEHQHEHQQKNHQSAAHINQIQNHHPTGFKAKLRQLCTSKPPKDDGPEVHWSSSTPKHLHQPIKDGYEHFKEQLKKSGRIWRERRHQRVFNHDLHKEINISSPTLSNDKPPIESSPLPPHNTSTSVSASASASDLTTEPGIVTTTTALLANADEDTQSFTQCPASTHQNTSSAGRGRVIKTSSQSNRGGKGGKRGGRYSGGSGRGRGRSNGRGGTGSSGNGDDGGGGDDTGTAGTGYVACLFYKLDPIRFERCGFLQIGNPGGLKTHLKGKHTLKADLCCRRCRTTLKTPREAQQHIAEQSCLQADIRDGMMTPEEFKSLAFPIDRENRAPRVRNTAYYHRLWNTLFGNLGEPFPDNMYLDVALNQRWDLAQVDNATERYYAKITANHAGPISIPQAIREALIMQLEELRLLRITSQLPPITTTEQALQNDSHIDQLTSAPPPPPPTTAPLPPSSTSVIDGLGTTANSTYNWSMTYMPFIPESVELAGDTSQLQLQSQLNNSEFEMSQLQHQGLELELHPHDSIPWSHEIGFLDSTFAVSEQEVTNHSLMGNYNNATTQTQASHPLNTITLWEYQQVPDMTPTQVLDANLSQQQQQQRLDMQEALDMLGLPALDDAESARPDPNSTLPP